MTPPDTPSPDPGRVAVALRVAAVVGVVLAATWASHLLRDRLEVQLMAGNESAVRRFIMLGTLAYVVLLALPFVPGAEIGLAMLAAFGAEVVPLVYGATVLAMMLSYTVGRLVPAAVLVRLLSYSRLERAAGLVSRAAALSPDARLVLLMDGAPPRTVGLALRHRYLALALAVNVPGNALIGGGGGIMLMAGISRLFTPLRTAAAVVIAVSPVPLLVMFFGG